MRFLDSDDEEVCRYFASKEIGQEALSHTVEIGENEELVGVYGAYTKI